MDFELMRPMISGVLGGLFAMIFCRALAGWIPQICNGKSAETILRENRVLILVANALFFCGILIGFALSQFGLLSDADWRAVALGLGGGSAAALISLPLLATIRGSSPKEAFVAFAISQNVPPILLYSVLILLSAWFAAAISTVLPAQ